MTALLFDLDGVLVHSMPLHVEAWRQYLAKWNIDSTNIEHQMHGKRNAELVVELFGDHLPENIVLEHGAAKERLWRELMLKAGVDRYRVRGVTEFLEKYKALPKAVGSNAEPANIEFVLTQFHLRPYFDVVVNGLEVQRPKPFPDIYLKAAQLLGYEPSECIVFEDSPPGVEAALAANMRVVGVETTPTKFPKVDLQIQDFADTRLDAWLAAQIRA